MSVSAAVDHPWSVGPGEGPHLHLADAWNNLTSNGLRYISNPPGNTARVHPHMEMSEGEVDYDDVFADLAAVGFDGVISSCVFGREDDADGVNARQREQTHVLIDKHFNSIASLGLRLSRGSVSVVSSRGW